MNKLDGILDSFVHDIRNADHEYSDSLREKAFMESKQQIIQIVQEIIGEDEINNQEDFSEPMDNLYYSHLNTRNNLKDEQRTKAKELLGDNI